MTLPTADLIRIYRGLQPPDAKETKVSEPNWRDDPLEYTPVVRRDEPADIATALPGDVYAAPDGKLWRVKHLVRTPLVEVQEIEGQRLISQAPIDAPLWRGWRRVWRKGE